MNINFDIADKKDIAMTWGLMCTINPTLMLKLAQELVEGVGPVVKQDKKEKVTVPAPKQDVPEPPPHEDSDRQGYEPPVKTEEVTESVVIPKKEEEEKTPEPEADYTLNELQDMIKSNLAIAKTKKGDDFQAFRQAVIELIENNYGVKASSLIPTERITEAYIEIQKFFGDNI